MLCLLSVVKIAPCWHDCHDEVGQSIILKNELLTWVGFHDFGPQAIIDLMSADLWTRRTHGPPADMRSLTSCQQWGKTFFRKTTFFFRSRDPFKKHGAEILCRTALVSRKIDLRRPHSWPKEFVHFCPNLGSGGEHLKWARPQTNCGQEKINAWAYPHCREPPLKGICSEGRKILII